jgi:hypothetical protein
MQLVADLPTVAVVPDFWVRSPFTMDGIMRFCCIVAMIVLGTFSWSPHPNSALAQPYQKNWQNAGQPGAGSYQKHLGMPPQSACQPYCQGKCYPPCEPDQPKDAVPDQPRAAVPGIAPGVFVAPPQAGVVEGPSRGFEIGNVSLTLPEITLGLPRLRWEGVKRLSRDARLMTDRAAAPYAANPYYAAAMAELQARESARDAVKATDDSDRSAKKDAQPEKDRGAEQKSCGGEPGSRGGAPTDVEQRLQSLENAVRLQMETLQDCIEDLKTQRSGAGGYPRAPVIVPVPAPCDAGKGAADVRIHPDRFPPAAPGTAFAPDVRPASYQVLMPVETTAPPDSLRRLPPVTQVPDR